MPYEFYGRRSGDISRLVADSSLANLILGWIPKYELSKMCLDGWRWKKTQIPNLRKTNFDNKNLF